MLRSIAFATKLLLIVRAFWSAARNRRFGYCPYAQNGFKIPKFKRIPWSFCQEELVAYRQ